MENDQLEPGSHPGDYDNTLERNLSEVANDESYSGQSVGFNADPNYNTRAEPEPVEEDKVQGLMPEDEAEEDRGIDVIE